MSTCTAILVFARPGETGRPALKCAANLADRFEATLIGLAAQPLPASLADGQLAVALDLREQRIAALLSQHLAHEGAERVHVVTKRRVLGGE